MHVRSGLAALALTTAALIVAIPARAHAQGKAVPVFENGQAQIVPAFADSTKWIMHHVWVETDFDSDKNGKLDRMHMDVWRQGQTETEGLKVPVIFESSPYFSGTSGPRENLWDVKQEVGAPPPPRTHQNGPAFRVRDTLSRSMVGTWVPRGFAVVHSEAPGTGQSDGCITVGDHPEEYAPKAVIDWLNGRAKGYTTATGMVEVKATWTTGKVGMVGTSYNGTTPLAAATTGVKGLEAIIPIAPNTSYYHYYRTNGLVRAPGGWLGEDIDFLYDYINSGRPENRDHCNQLIRDGLFAQGRDRQHGDYNSFWAARDLLPKAKNIKAAVLMSHAFNDPNVVPEHSVRIYNALKKNHVPLMAYFHQGGHGGGPPMEMQNRWFTRYLYDVQNGVEKDPRAWIVREDDDPMKPTPYAEYPNPAAKPVVLHLQVGGSRAGVLTFAKTTNKGTERLLDDVQYTGVDLGRAEQSPNRLLYVTPTLKTPVHLSGTSTITVELASSKPATNLSVWLVSLPWQVRAVATPPPQAAPPANAAVQGGGRAAGGGRAGRGGGGRGAAADSTGRGAQPGQAQAPPAAGRGRGNAGPQYALPITRGWADPQNYESLTKSGDYHSLKPGKPLVPGKFYRLTFDLEPDDQIIPAGQKLGLMIFSSDRDNTLWPQPGTELTVKLESTSIQLPVVGGQAALKRAIGETGN